MLHAGTFIFAIHIRLLLISAKAPTAIDCQCTSKKTSTNADVNYPHSAVADYSFMYPKIQCRQNDPFVNPQPAY